MADMTLEVVAIPSLTCGLVDWIPVPFEELVGDGAVWVAATKLSEDLRAI